MDYTSRVMLRACLFYRISSEDVVLIQCLISSQGFYELIPQDLIKIFDENELEVSLRFQSDTKAFH